MLPLISNQACGKCKRLVNGRTYLHCVDCKSYYHIECKGYEKRFIPLDADRKSKWKCDLCARKGARVNSHKTPLRPMPTAIPTRTTSHITPTSNSFEGLISDDEVTDPFQNVTIRNKSRKENADLSAKDMCYDSPLEITSALKEYIAVQMATFTNQLLSKIDELSISLQGFDIRCGKIEQRISLIEKRLDSPIDKKVDVRFNDLVQTVDRLKKDLNDRDQELLANEIELSGIPESNGENSIHIVTLIGSKLGVKINESDVVSAARVGGARHEPVSSASHVGAGGVRTSTPRPTTPGHNAAPAGPASVAANVGEETGPRLLVVRFLRRAQRDELLRAARVRRNVDTAGLGLPGTARRFYVNERLTHANRLLFRCVRDESRRLGWRFAWTRNGAILVRRDNGEPARRIRTEEDLVKVFGAKSVSAQ